MKWLIDSLFFCFSLLPETAAICFGTGLGWLLEHIIRFRRRTVIAQIDSAFPELDVITRRRLRRDFYRHIGLLGVEFMRQPRLSAAAVLAKTVMHGREHLESALAQGKGVLVLAGHLGNWEISLAGGVRHKLNMQVIFKEVNGVAGQYFIDRLRKTHGVQGIPRRDSIFQILRLLKKNTVIGFVLDQNMTADEGIFVDFFGRPACTMPGLAVLAQRLGCPVLPCAFYRDADRRRHHIVIGPAIPWEESGADAAAVIRHNTQRYTTVLETLIRQHPEQWLWNHRRWRTRPPAA